MCCIIVCPGRKRPSLETLEAVALENPHGLGLAWQEGEAVQYAKSDDVGYVHKLARRAMGNVVIHARIASVGGVHPQLRHPFPVTSRAGLSERSSAPAVLFQNGTWPGWREAVREAEADGHVPPAGIMSDARAAAWLCSIRGQHNWLAGVQSRWVYFSTSALVWYGPWSQRGGLFFSNTYWERD